MTTPILGLSEIAEGVTSQAALHNTALREFEARTVRVLSRTTTAPPGSPAESDSYIIPAGTWVGAVNQIAAFLGGAWSYYTPIEGITVWVNDVNITYVYDGAAWVTIASTSPLTTKGDVYTYSTVNDRLGVGANGTVLTADSAAATGIKWSAAAAGGSRLDQITTGTADSTLTTSGFVTINSGVGAANAVGKTVTIQPGAGGATNAAGGPLNATGGTGAGTGAGGAVTITGGSGGAGSASVGGAVTIQGGAASAVAGSTGGTASVVAAAGSATGTGAAGASVAITAGNAGGSAANNGGDITLTTGTATSTGVPGNIISLSGVCDQAYSKQVPTTGFSITIAAGLQTLILDPAGTLATGTITLPAKPADGQQIRITSTQMITALTVAANAGQSIKNAPTTFNTSLTGAQGYEYMYVIANTTWYRLQ